MEYLWLYACARVNDFHRNRINLNSPSEITRKHVEVSFNSQSKTYISRFNVTRLGRATRFSDLLQLLIRRRIAARRGTKIKERKSLWWTHGSGFLTAVSRISSKIFGNNKRRRYDRFNRFCRVPARIVNYFKNQFFEKYIKHTHVYKIIFGKISRRARTFLYCENIRQV